MKLDLSTVKDEKYKLVRVSARILSEGTPGRGTPWGFGGYPPKARKKMKF